MPISLPTELWLNIIEQLKPVNDSSVIGENGCWTNPSVFWLGRRTCPEEEDGRTMQNPLSPLLLLRQTNRFFNAACLQHIFNELNLVRLEPVWNTSIPQHYAQHIRTLRLCVDPAITTGYHNGLAGYQRLLANLLELCLNLASLGLYYRKAASSWGAVSNAAIVLLERGKLRSLGIYSITVTTKRSGNWDWNYVDPNAAAEFLASVALNSRSTASVQGLDIAMETMPMKLYNLLRSKFNHLRRLHIRRGLRLWAFEDRELGRIWEPTQVDKWYGYGNLTALSLVDCSSVYAPHIPELVSLFKSLKYLTISTCGAPSDAFPSSRKEGWQAFPDALWKSRQPLERFHVEHMLDWEILALGIIPTLELVFSDIRPGHIHQAIQADPHIFPALVTLRIQAIQAATDLEELDRSSLNSICEARSIALFKDARCIRPRPST